VVSETDIKTPMVIILASRQNYSQNTKKAAFAISATPFASAG
jgi:hypothetical protein